VGLVSRAIEAAGIPTVSLSIVREVTEKTPPPRALYLRFPFGHALGEVGQRDQQFDILLRAFRLLFEAEVPGTIRDSGLRWRRESYPAPDFEAFRSLAPVPRLPKG
jgi:D-proline reductase (dithiol) PrdB